MNTNKCNAYETSTCKRLWRKHEGESSANMGAGGVGAVAGRVREKSSLNVCSYTILFKFFIESINESSAVDLNKKDGSVERECQ